MNDPMELVERLEGNAKQTITRYCGDLDGAIVPHALLSEAAACIRELVEWRPIETAPKDGKPFTAVSMSRHGELYDSKTFKPFSCWWSEAGDFSDPAWVREVHGFRSFGNHVAHPTHWLPLPLPPADRGGV